MTFINILFNKTRNETGRKKFPIIVLGVYQRTDKETWGFEQRTVFLWDQRWVPNGSRRYGLMSFSKKGLDQMLHICWLYSCKWRYYYNAQQHFMLGQEVLELCESYCHLGVTCEKHLSVKSSINEACVKFRGSFFSAANGCLHPGFINPRTLRVIYQSVVLPKALYGCEFWSTYTKQVKKCC